MAKDAVGSGAAPGDPDADQLMMFLAPRLAEAGRIGSSDGVHDGWHITLQLLAESNSAVGELIVTIRPVARHDAGAPPINVDSVAQATEIMARFRSVPPTSWHIAPSAQVLRIHCQVQVDDPAALLWLSVPGDPPVADADSDGQRHAHIVRETELVESLVDGRVVRSMCGHVFVPTETGERTRARPVCTRCALVVAVAKAIVD